ncbi:hypothetical protein AB1K83_13415 [Sporosarcina sp. 179-K 3D1 HS]
MAKQWNFIFDNKLITVFDKDPKSAEKQARAIFKDLQKNNAS